MNPTKAEMQAMRQAFAAQQQQAHGGQLAVLQQMWLELVRALAEQGVLNAEALAQRLEAHAQRAPDDADWFFGLVDAARRLRQTSSDPDSLVQ